MLPSAHAPPRASGIDPMPRGAALGNNNNWAGVGGLAERPWDRWRVGDPSRPRCGAKTKRTGLPCTQPPVKGRARCRFPRRLRRRQEPSSGQKRTGAAQQASARRAQGRARGAGGDCPSPRHVGSAGADLPLAHLSARSGAVHGRTRPLPEGRNRLPRMARYKASLRRMKLSPLSEDTTRRAIAAALSLGGFADFAAPLLDRRGVASRDGTSPPPVAKTSWRLDPTAGVLRHPARPSNRTSVRDARGHRQRAYVLRRELNSAWNGIKFRLNFRRRN